MQSSEPFDELKVAVKRGEIDWLHIAPGATGGHQSRQIVSSGTQAWHFVEHRKSDHVGVVVLLQGQKIFF